MIFQYRQLYHPRGTVANSGATPVLRWRQVSGDLISQRATIRDMGMMYRYIEESGLHTSADLSQSSLRQRLALKSGDQGPGTAFIHFHKINALEFMINHIQAYQIIN